MPSNTQPTTAHASKHAAHPAHALMRLCAFVACTLVCCVHTSTPHHCARHQTAPPLRALVPGPHAAHHPQLQPAVGGHGRVAVSVHCVRGGRWAAHDDSRGCGARAAGALGGPVHRVTRACRREEHWALTPSLPPCCSTRAKQIRVCKVGHARKHDAHVVAVCADADVAVLGVGSAAFWEGLQPVALCPGIPELRVRCCCCCGRHAPTRSHQP